MSMSKIVSFEQVIQRITILYQSFGEIDYIGEPVSILEHSLQGGYFARREKQTKYQEQQAPLFCLEDEEFILAALFHDIGHVLGLESFLEMRMGNCGIMDHEEIGGEFLHSLGFTQRVVELVRNHVQAKRYLCYSLPDYYQELSEASKTTLGYQGGPMLAEEGKAFENHPLFEDILLLRRMDEAGKVEKHLGLDDVPVLVDYSEMIRRNLEFRKVQDQQEKSQTTETEARTRERSFGRGVGEGVVEQKDAVTATADTTASSVVFSFGRRFKIPSSIVPAKGYILSNIQLKQFQENSFLKITNLLSYYQITVEQLRQWVDEISSWPKDVEKKWLMHYELSQQPLINNDPVNGTIVREKILCRIENFVNYHSEVAILTKDLILDIVSQLLQESAALLKEKINFKLSGGAGFACHQDTPAYLGLGEAHISVMVAIDDATIENGCLEVAAGEWEKGQVHLTKDGIVVPEEEAAMTFQPLQCKAGDIVFFTGYIPHRSKANLSDRSRRAMFLTYNPLSHGDFHDQYYEAKHAKQHGFDANHAISFQNDFQGVIVD